MARPKKELNWETVEGYIQSGCKSGVALARKFEIHRNTFYEKFKEEYGCSFQDYSADSYEVGDIDIMRMLHAKALNNKAPGNATLLMFLARCRLGMKEPEVQQLVAANQDNIDKDHEIMQLKYRITQMESNAHESKAGSELLRSDTPL